MKISAVVLAIATVVAAAPNYGGGKPTFSQKKISAEEFVNKCGRNNVSCCNKEVERTEIGSDNSEGLLNVLNGLGVDSVSVFDQCSKLAIPVNVIGASIADLLNKQCSQKISCCGNNGKSFNGLVNADLGCAVPNLL